MQGCGPEPQRAAESLPKALEAVVGFRGRSPIPARAGGGPLSWGSSLRGVALQRTRSPAENLVGRHGCC